MTEQTRINGNAGNQEQKCTNLGFLQHLTKGNSKMIMEMIQVYLEETPRLLDKLRHAIDEKDWDTSARTAHSLIPSFSTMGMSKEFTGMAKKIQEYSEKKENTEQIGEMFRKIDSVCVQARQELEQDLVDLKK